MSDFLLGYCVGMSVAYVGMSVACVSMAVAWVIAAIILSLRS